MSKPSGWPDGDEELPIRGDDVGEKVPYLPEIDLPTHVCLDYGDFDRALTAAEMVANHITFRLDTDTEQFVAEASGDTDDVELTRDVNDLSDATIKPANSLFSLDYLTKIKAPIPTGTTLDIRLGKDLPATIDLTLDELTAQYALAPESKQIDINLWLLLKYSLDYLSNTINTDTTEICRIKR